MTRRRSQPSSPTGLLLLDYNGKAAPGRRAGNKCSSGTPAKSFSPKSRRSRKTALKKSSVVVDVAPPSPVSSLVSAGSTGQDQPAVCEAVAQINFAHLVNIRTQKKKMRVVQLRRFRFRAFVFLRWQQRSARFNVDTES